MYEEEEKIHRKERGNYKPHLSTIVYISVRKRGRGRRYTRRAYIISCTHLYTREKRPQIAKRNRVKWYVKW